MDIKKQQPGGSTDHIKTNAIIFTGIPSGPEAATKIPFHLDCIEYIEQAGYNAI